MDSWNVLCDGLGIALNESSLLGVEVVPLKRIAAATFRVLTLPAQGPMPEDTRVQILFRPVGRVVASLRNGRWDDPNAQVIPFEITNMLEIVRGFGNQPIYGWNFFDQHEKLLSECSGRMSLDWQSGFDGLAHSIRLFQESTGKSDRYLELCIWFDALELRQPDGSSLSIEEFIAGGKRWWDGLFAGDPRTQNQGIFPASGEG